MQTFEDIPPVCTDSGIALMQVQGLKPDLVELHDVCVGLLLRSV